MQAIIIFGRGCRKIVEVIIIGKGKDTHGAITIAEERSLWSTEVSHLSLLFLLFLVNRNLLDVCQNCLPVHLILKLVYLPLLQSITRASRCSISAMSTIKHLMVALILACFQRFMEPLQSQKLPIDVACPEYVSSDAAGLLKDAPKRVHVFNKVLDEDFFENIQVEHFPLNIYFLNVVKVD